MSIRNSLKIVFSSFSGVWKILLYKLVVLLRFAGLLAGLVLPNVLSVVGTVADTGLFDNIRRFVSDFFTRGSELPADIDAVKASVDALSKAFADNAAKLTVSYIFIGLIILLTLVLSGLSPLVIADVINAKMSSNAVYGHASRFIIRFGKNIKLQAVKLITLLPCYILLLFSVWRLFSLLFGVIGLFSLFFAVIAFVLLLSLLQTFFCCMLPEIAVNNAGVFEAIRLGFGAARKKFGAILSAYIVIDVALLSINALLLFFTCGAGLIVSVPMSAIFLTAYRMVTYYDLKKKQYYIDENNISGQT
jgi:hypothetical protein